MKDDAHIVEVFRCPFCQAEVIIDHTDSVVGHDMPACEKFDTLEGTDYLEEVLRWKNAS